MYGVLLIAVLIITGGAIAFIGDRLGTKIGKKRLSIFGLRPRHTSIVITIFTGICITTLTFGVMAAASENVRTALFGMGRLNRTMQETQTNLNQTQAALQDAQTEQDRTDDALRQWKEDVAKLRSQQETLEANTRRLQEGNRQLELAKQLLVDRNDVLSVQNESLGRQNNTLSGTNTELSGRNEHLTANNQKLEKRTLDLRNGLITMREGDIIFRAGEVIASGVIRGNRSGTEVANDIQSLAQLANRNVSARMGKDNSDEDIWIYQPEYDAAVKSIASSPQDMVVRIVAAGNLVRGEAVRTSLELYKNSVIYKNQEFIIAKPYALDSGTDAEAEQTVMSFLKDVNLAATAKGILPDPLRGSVGVIEGAQFYEMVHSLRGVRGTVVLSAYAKGNTDALGPLRLTLKMDQRPDNAIR